MRYGSPSESDPEEYWGPPARSSESCSAAAATTCEHPAPEDSDVKATEAVADRDGDTEPNHGGLELVVRSQPVYKTLYEGPAVCKCCTKWTEKYPQNLESDSADKAEGAEVILRYGIAHRGKRGKPLELHLYSITLKQGPIMQLVRGVLETLPGTNLNGHELTFTRPFRQFFYCWDEFTAACKEGDGAKLYSALEDDLRADLTRSAELTSQGLITCDLFWTIFRPGTVMLRQNEAEKRLYLVQCPPERNYYRWYSPPSLEAKALYLDFDGNRYGWIKSCIPVNVFAGARRITELDIVPLKYLHSRQSVVDEMYTRGVKVASMSPRAYQAYAGFIGRVDLYSHDFYSEDRKVVETYVEGRIIVDPVEYFRAKLSRKLHVEQDPTGLKGLNTGQHDRSDLPVDFDDNNGDANPGIGSVPDLLSQHRWTQAVLQVPPEVFLSYTVRGYCLTSKDWAEFNVVCTHEIEWNDEAFDMLVMSSHKKRLLKALIEEQRHSKKITDDIIQGKGQGLILLLSGPPGTGKTLTAESVADRLRLPLYALNASQLGQDGTEAEAALNQVLRLAAEWDAVLLLDEADAFIEKRSSNGNDPNAASRNRRVAAFLRVLEYYRGVLVLTTNRPVEFDEAFFSRIHLTVRYPTLEQASRRTIWQNFLMPITTSISEDHFDTLAEHSLNGRQIKNVVKMARLFAKNEGEPLTNRYLEDVISVMTEDLVDSLCDAATC